LPVSRFVDDPDIIRRFSATIPFFSRRKTDGPLIIKNLGTNLVREAVTAADGSFVVPDLLAGTYDVKVTMPGFKSPEQTGIILGATERVTLKRIELGVGQLEETVFVTGASPLVQTQTAARSGLIQREQMDDIALKGRDFAGLLKILPGVVDTSSREAPGWGSMGGLTINGRNGGFNFAYGGVTNKETGSNSVNWSAPALDSIGEVSSGATTRRDALRHEGDRRAVRHPRWRAAA
jgi:hypothetical protein